MQADSFSFGKLSLKNLTVPEGGQRIGRCGCSGDRRYLCFQSVLNTQMSHRLYQMRQIDGIRKVSRAAVICVSGKRILVCAVQQIINVTLRQQKVAVCITRHFENMKRVDCGNAVALFHGFGSLPRYSTYHEPESSR